MENVQVKLNPDFPWQNSIEKYTSLLTSKLELNLRNELAKCCFWSIALYGAETWTLRKVTQNNW